jgi:hypothetical protein
MSGFHDIAFTPSVRALQERAGSRAAYARMERNPDDGLGAEEVAFIRERDSLYLATVSETGWPHVQHRGGSRGFLRVLGPRRLAFADFRGNRQFVTAGNVSGNDRVALILMDYPNRQRLKVLGRARVIAWGDAAEDLRAALVDPGSRLRPERVFAIDVAGFDWNCPQHVTPRFTADEVERMVAPLRARLAALEATPRAAVPSGAVTACPVQGDLTRR